MQVGAFSPTPEGTQSTRFIFSPSDGGVSLWSEQRAGTGPWGDPRVSSHACTYVSRASAAALALSCQGLSGPLGHTLLNPVMVVEKRSQVWVNKPSWAAGQ